MASNKLSDQALEVANKMIDMIMNFTPEDQVAILNKVVDTVDLQFQKNREHLLNQADHLAQVGKALPVTIEKTNGLGRN